MYEAPEVEHLRRAVDAVKRGLMPQKKTEAETEAEEEQEPEPSDEVGPAR